MTDSMDITQWHYDPSKDRRGYRITLLVDEPDAWIVPWADALARILNRFHNASLVHRAADIAAGDFCFLLGCVRRLPSESLSRNQLNLVVHESDLPQGRGYSPIAWQVIEGRRNIPVCLLTAAEDPDTGPVFIRDAIVLDGTELLPEIRRMQGNMTVSLCLRFLERWPDIVPSLQTGTPTEFRRRNVSDDEIDPQRPIAEQFDHLRIVDNERYPAWFEIRGRRYKLKIMPYEPPPHRDGNKC